MSKKRRTKYRKTNKKKEEMEGMKRYQKKQKESRVKSEDSIFKIQKKREIPEEELMEIKTQLKKRNGNFGSS